MPSCQGPATGLKWSRSMDRLAAWMVSGWVYEKGLQEPGFFRRLREKITVILSLLGAVEKMDPDSSQRCKSQHGARVSKDKSQQLATRQVLIRQKGKQNSQEGGKALEQVVQGSGGLPSLGFFRSGWDKFLSNLIWWHLC